MDLAHLIQSVLAPCVMISSAALLLLGFQNKFSNLANRFRALTHEKRLLMESLPEQEKTRARLRSLEEQIRDLGQRAGYVKQAILFAYFSIICFTCISILIFSHVYLSLEVSHVSFLFFLLGMLFILASAVCMILETRLFYKIILLEKKS